MPKIISIKKIHNGIHEKALACENLLRCEILFFNHNNHTPLSSNYFILMDIYGHFMHNLLMTTIICITILNIIKKFTFLC